MRRRVTKMCNDYQLANVKLIILPGSGQGGYGAYAMPERYNPIVEKRWREETARLSEADGFIGLEELNRVSEWAMKSIAYASGSSIEAVLKALEAKLPEPKD